MKGFIKPVSVVCLLASAAAIGVGCRDDRALGTERDRRDDYGAPRFDPMGAPRDVPPEATDVNRDTTKSPTAGGAVASAVQSIAAATCDHAQRCGEIGAGTDRDHASRDACMSKVKADLGDDLTESKCPGGIIQKELEECLSEARDYACGNPLDALGKLAACRTSDLCNAVP